MSKKTAMHNLKSSLRWFSILGLSATLLLAEEKGVDPQKVIDALNMREDVSLQLDEMAKWEDEHLLLPKVRRALNSLFEDSSLPKRDRLALVDFNVMTMLPKEGFNQDKFADQLIAMLKTSSPSVLKKCIQTLVELDGIKNTTTIAKLDKLVTDIFTDAAEESDKQRFPSALHAIALQAFKAEKASSKQVKILEELLANSDELSPSTRIALYNVIGNLFESKPSGLTRTYKADISKTVSGLFQNHPGALAVGASEGEVEELKALLYGIRHMIADKDLDSLVAKVHPTLTKLLSQESPTIARASGDALIALQKSENRVKVKAPIGALFLSQLSATMQTKAETNEKAVYLSKSIAALTTHFLDSEEKEEKAQISPILKAVGRLSFYPIDIQVRISLLDSFFAIEPRHIEDEKLLDEDTKKLLAAFFKQAVTFLLEPKKIAEQPEFTEQLANVLYEITGKDLGSDGKQWGEWLRKDGKEYFN